MFHDANPFLDDILDIPTGMFNPSSADFNGASDALNMSDIDWCNAPSTQLRDSYRGVSMAIDCELFTQHTKPSLASLSPIPSFPKDVRDDVFIPVHLKTVPIATNSNSNKKRASPSTSAPSSSVREKVSFSLKLSPQDSSSLCPVKPLMLQQTHMKLCLPPASSFAVLLQTLQDVLDGCADFDFCFYERLMQWRGKYLCGKKRCLVMLHLYCDLERSGGFVLEAVKTKGDAKVFHELFRELLETLGESDFVDRSTNKACTVPNKKAMRCACLSVPLSLSRALSLDELLAHLENIDAMAKCECLESRLSAAELLCDLDSIDGALLGEQAVVEKILHIVETLLFSSPQSLPLSGKGSMEKDFFALFEEEEEDLLAEIAEQALVALSLLCAATPAFQESLLIPMHRETLRVVAMMVSDAPSETAFLSAQLRRECALLLLSLAQFDAAVFVRQLRDSLSDSVQTWLETLSELRDTKLRDHGMSLQNMLLAVM